MQLAFWRRTVKMSFSWFEWTVVNLLKRVPTTPKGLLFNQWSTHAMLYEYLHPVLGRPKLPWRRPPGQLTFAQKSQTTGTTASHAKVMDVMWSPHGSRGRGQGMKEKEGVGEEAVLQKQQRKEGKAYLWRVRCILSQRLEWGQKGGGKREDSGGNVTGNIKEGRKQKRKETKKRYEEIMVIFRGEGDNGTLASWLRHGRSAHSETLIQVSKQARRCCDSPKCPCWPMSNTMNWHASLKIDSFYVL